MFAIFIACLLTITAMAQTGTLKGRVVDAQGEPLIGASLMVRGTTLGFISDYDGNYSLTGISYPANLVVSFIGLKDVEIALDGSEPDPFVIVMADSATELDEVVVVGYGTQKKANLTGAVSVIDGKDLNQRPVTNTALALQGADPSLILTTGSGNIEGNQFSLNIRGNVSLTSGSPIVLIDGVEGDLGQVNPNDIANISVLKDASACAIYGAKASAGVVLITTKSGEEGKAKITYNGRVSVSQNTTSTDFMTASYDYITLCNEFYTYLKGYGAYTYTDEQIQMMKDRRYDVTENPERPWVIPDTSGLNTYIYLGNYDWYNEVFKRVRPETEHNVTVRGGNDRMHYYASGRYLYKEGLFNNASEDIYNSVSFRAKFDAKVTKWLDYSVNVSFERMKYAYGGFWEQDGSDGHMSSGILFNLTQNVGPMYVPYNPDGTINIQPGFMADATSPLFSGRAGAFLDGRNHNQHVNNYLTLTNRLTFNIVKGLKFIADYTYRRHDKLEAYRSFPTLNAYDNVNKRMYIGSDATIPQGTFTNGSIYDFYREHRYYRDGNTVNAFFQYNGSFGDHNLGVTLGGNFDNYRSSTSKTQQNGSLNDLAYINNAEGNIYLAKETNSAYRTLGFFGRVNYDYKGRYLVEVSGRYDGSSRFPKGDRWGFFPSVSAGWRLSEESFWEPIKGWWNRAKFRASFGSLGNQQVDNYYYWDTITTSLKDFTFTGNEKVFAATNEAPVSSSLTWETVMTTNVGLDLGFLKDRLSFSGDFYIRDTKNMLTKARTLPAVFGESAPRENAADMRTIGYELSLSWRDSFRLAGKPFSYGVSASLGDNVSKITRFDNEKKALSDNYVGKRLGDIWGYTTAGLFKTDEEAAAYAANVDDKNANKGVYGGKAPYNHLMAGDIIYVDLDKNGKIDTGENTLDNPGDRRVIGNSLPRYNYSLRGDFQWYGIDFQIFFQGVGKINWMPAANCIYFWGPYSYQRPTFIDKNFEKLCWSSEEGADNSKAVFPRRRGRLMNSSNRVVSDYFLQDASYIRLKNLTIGYTIPFKTKAVEKARIYFSGENLAYWSPMKKYCRTVDPEVATTSAADDCVYPYSKTFSFGIDITF